MAGGGTAKAVAAADGVRMGPPGPMDAERSEAPY